MACSLQSEAAKLPMLLGSRQMQSPAPKGSAAEEAKEEKPQPQAAVSPQHWAPHWAPQDEEAPSASDRRAEYVLDCMGLRHIYHCAGLARKS